MKVVGERVRLVREDEGLKYRLPDWETGSCQAAI